MSSAVKMGEAMRRTSIVFAAMALLVATLASAHAQTPPPAPDPFEGTWVWSGVRNATCRNADVEKEIGYRKWVIAQDQKDLQAHQASVDATRARMTTLLMSGKATGVDVSHDVNVATSNIKYHEAEIKKIADRIAISTRVLKYLEGLPPCVPGTQQAAQTPPAPPPGNQPPPTPPQQPPAQTVPPTIAPEHSSVVPPPGATPGAVPAAVTPVTPRPGLAYYNTPYNTPYYNSPLEALFDFYNTPYNTPLEPRLRVTDGFYIGVDGGLSFVPTYNATEFFDDGFKDRFPWASSVGSYFGAQVGVQTGNLRFEGQYTWSSNSAAPTGPLAPDVKLGGGTDAFGLFVNGIYTPPFQLGLPVTPHIGVGFGALDVTTKIKLNDMTVFNSSGWAPAAQAIGGLTWTISPRWSLDLNYRYQTSLSDVEFRSLKVGDFPRNKVTAPYEGHYVTLDLNLHFPAGTRPPAPAAPPTPKSEIPQARQVAALTPVETAAVAAHRFTLRYDEAHAVLTPSSVRALHDALDAIEAGQDVRIAVAGCATDADYSDGSPCAHRAQRIQHLLSRYGVESPSHYFVGG